MEYCYINSRLTGVGSLADLKEQLKDLKDDKQDTLISGLNIKTINNQSLIGAGNIDPLSAGTGNIEKEILSAEALGGVPAGTVFAAGTSVESILRLLLSPGTTYKVYSGVSLTPPSSVNNFIMSLYQRADILQNGLLLTFNTVEQPALIEGKYCAFAIPAAIGALIHAWVLASPAGDIDLISEWTSQISPQSITINNEAYHLYCYSQPIKASNITFKFKFLAQGD